MLATKKFSKYALVFGSFGGNNFGDVAILKALCNVCAIRGYRVRACSFNPVKLRIKMGECPTNLDIINIFNLLRVFQSLWSCSEVIVGGGGLFFDKGIFDILTPFRGSQIIVWCLVSLLARILGKKVNWLGVGFGPLSGTGKLLVKVFGKLSEKITVRDSASYKLLSDELNFKNVLLSADLVFLEQEGGEILKLFESRYASPRNRKLLLILKGARKLEEYYAVLILAMRAKHPGWKISLAGTNPKMDGQILKRLATKTSVKFIDTGEYDLDGFKRLLQQFDFVITNRVHALLLAFQQGVLGVGFASEESSTKAVLNNKVVNLHNELYSKTLWVDGSSIEDLLSLVEAMMKFSMQKDFFAITENYQRLRERAKINFSE